MQPIAQRMTRAIKALMIVHTLSFLVYAIVLEARPFIGAHLLVGPGFWHEPWQLVTSLFVNPYPAELGATGAFLMNLLGFWFVGADVERALGVRRFISWYFATGVLATFAAGLLSTVFGVKGTYGGLDIAVVGLFVAFARVHGGAPISLFGAFAMKSSHLAMVAVGVSLVGDLARRDVAGLASTLVVSGAGWVLAGKGGWRAALDGLRARRARQRYRVLEGGAPSKRKPKSRDEKYWN
jgi:membrane associated rhomboid family serine protease